MFSEVCFKNEKDLSREEIKFCFKIILAMGREQFSLREISEKMGVERKKVKKYIEIIRASMVTKFQNPTGKFFIIKKGKYYEISDILCELEEYRMVILQKQNNLYNQMVELEKYKKFIQQKASDVYNQYVQIELAIKNKKGEQWKK